jgi:hypothetical protein
MEVGGGVRYRAYLQRPLCVLSLAREISCPAARGRHNDNETRRMPPPWNHQDV